MICCKCGKEIAREEACPMIFKDSDFDKYPKGDYFCCHKCDALWQELKRIWFQKIKLSKNFSDTQAWLYLFFECFVDDENPSRRRRILKLI